jgi:hypothetical protein
MSGFRNYLNKGYRLSIKRETAMKPAATSGTRARIVFQTCPRVSRTFNLPAINRARNPSPENETTIRKEEMMCT